MHVCFRFSLAGAAGLTLAVLCVLLPARVQAQEVRPDSVQTQTSRADTAATDSLRRRPARPDSLPASAARPDTTRPDSLAPGAPEGAGPGAGAAGNAVQFSARDSLVIVFGQDDQGDVGTLYGEAEVKHQNATLTAYEVQMLLNEQKLRAAGPPPGPAPDTVGLPRFKRGEGEAFTGSELSFNLETGRGRVVKARTGFREGYVQGNVVRVDKDSTLYVRGGRYTTCNCPRGQTPSYSMRSRKMKVQGKWVYTGPVQLFLYNIPTPLILPFAFLPATTGRRGGIIPPSYGEQDRLGFYLKNFGYYWPINDYMDLQLTGSLWSRGSWGLSPTFRYKRRYRYDGDLHVDYVRNIAGDVVDSDYLNKTTAKIQWYHNQNFNPTMSLSANVNLASRTYRKVVSDNFDDNVTQRTSSSVNFRKRWGNGDQNLSVNLSQSQNLTTGEAHLTLPELRFSQRDFQPFKRERRGPGEEERWYEKITTSYDGSLTNGFDFNPLTDQELRERQGVPDSVSSDSLDRPGIAWYDALFSQEKYRRATGDTGQRFDFGATHRIPINASFNLPRYQLNITPNFNYREEWFTSTQRRVLRVDSTVVEGDSVVVDSSIVTRDKPGFFAAREFNLGVGANTTFYGRFPLRLGALRGLRHTVQPSLSFSYSPNYNADFFGRTRTLEVSDDETIRYDITTGSQVRGSNEQRRLNFNLGNVFETKQVRTDSTGAEQTETLRLLRLDARTSYNFAADSLRLSDLRVGARFPVLRTKYNVDANLDFTLSPYVYDSRGRRQLNRLVLNESGFFPARLTDFDVSISTDFQGGEQDEQAARRQRRRNTGRPLGRSPLGRGAGQYGTGPYANFSIPWSLKLRLSYGFTNRAQFEQSDFLLNADFSFNVTPRWKVSGQSGYDFDQGELTATRLNITRDFDCWQMSFNWTPFGPNQRYGFNLRVKSSTLGNLLNLRLPRNEGRGFGDRLRGIASGVTGP